MNEQPQLYERWSVTFALWFIRKNVLLKTFENFGYSETKFLNIGYNDY